MRAASTTVEELARNAEANTTRSET